MLFILLNVMYKRVWFSSLLYFNDRKNNCW